MQRQHSLLVIGQAIYGSIHLRFVRGRFAYYTLIVRNTKGIATKHTNARGSEVMCSEIESGEIFPRISIFSKQCFENLNGVPD